jgi:integrase
VTKRRQYGSGTVRQLPSGKWQARFDVGYTSAGSRRRLSVVGNTEADAKRKLRDKQREVASSGAPAGDASRATVKSWAETWLTIKAHEVRPKTWAGYQSAVKQHIVPTIGHRRLDQLTPADVRAVSTAVRKAGRSSSTARHAHIVLTDMLTAAQREGYPVPARALLVDAPSPGVSDRDALPLTDALALLKVAAGTTGGSRFVAALLQGMRQGECLGLTWDLVDLDVGALDVSWQLQAIPYAHGCSGTCGRRFGGDCPQRGRRIPDGYEIRPLDGALCLTRPKTAKGQRIIPLVPWMAAALDAWQQVAPVSPHGLVWPRPDGRPALARVDFEEWVDLQNLAGVAHPGGRPWFLHEARHTTATLLAEAGVDPSTIMAILGHSSVATQAAYKHVRLDHVREALEGVAARLELA